MNLVKEITTSRLFIEIYSVNANLLINEDASFFEDKDDAQIRDFIFNEIGAEEVRLYDLTVEGEKENLRTYSIM
jgi:hypothetical protein